MDKTSLGDRQKRNYEDPYRIFLTRRIPVIVRIDGRSFHSITKHLFGKAWNNNFFKLMVQISQELQSEIAGCNFCYSQSDEISFLLTDYQNLDTQPYFDYNMNKLNSVIASMASSVFTKRVSYNKPIAFDARSFNLPKEEVNNYFYWRQQDATRNAVQMLGREHFSHKELLNKNNNEIQEMVFQKGINFNDLPTYRKRGFCICDSLLDTNIPVFSQDKSYVERFVYLNSEK